MKTGGFHSAVKSVCFQPREPAETGGTGYHRGDGVERVTTGRPGFCIGTGVFQVGHP
jgi:hypothetical protein